MIATVCLFVLMIIAAATDVRDQKIYNWTTYTGIIIALALNALATATDRTVFAELGITQSLVGFLACGAIMLICFVLFQIGGGDVKLLAMAGAFMGPEFGIQALLWSFVLGGAAAVIVLVWRLGAVYLLKRVTHQLMFRLRIGSWGPLKDDEKIQLSQSLYLAPSALLAVAIVESRFFDRLQSFG